MGRMRFVVLALAALLVAAAVAFAQDPGARAGADSYPGAHGDARAGRDPAPTATPVDPGVPPDFGAITWQQVEGARLARAQGPAGERRACCPSSARTSSPGTRSSTRSRTANGAAGARTA